MTEESRWWHILRAKLAAGGASKRLAARVATLAVSAAVVAVFVVPGGLDWRLALVSLAGLCIWAALWPVADQAEPHARAPADAGRGAAPASLPETWQPLLDGLPDAAIVLDGDGMILGHNAIAREILAVRPARHLSQFVRAPELLAAVEAGLRTGTTHAATIRLAVPLDRTLVATASPVRPLAGEARHPALLLVLGDRTEIDQVARLRVDFVANASHELRTPLASLKGFIETLQGAAKDDAAARERFLVIMDEQATRMARLIDDLLSLSRIEMHEHISPRDPVDLCGVVEEAARAVRALAEAAGIALAVVHPAHPAMVLGDRDELLQVAQNLVQNAIKYGRKGGHVELAVQESGAKLELSVTDDGIGIAPEHLPRLTERFYRVSAKDSRERGGTGLGLAIVKHIVNRHRASLQVTSRVGEGSRFAVAFEQAAEKKK